MAGEAVLSAFMEVVFSKASTAALHDLGLIRGVNKELTKLSNTLQTIRAVLEDAEKKQITNPAVRNWLRDLKDLAYDADDLLDEFAARDLQLKVGGGSQTAQVCDAFSSRCGLKHVLFRRRMAHEIKAIRGRLDEITKERNSLQLRELGGGETSRLDTLERPPAPTSSLIDESNVFGRDGDKEKLIELLVSERSSSMDLSVLPIVGMGGLGKTTLAQLVYNDQRVNDHFETKMWVYVSQNYSISRLTTAIMEAATKRECNITDLSTLQESLTMELRGKRFLLILDDVWNDNPAEWDRTRLPLRDGGSGSKIVITTRIKRVAEIMGTLHPYCLGSLSDNACWTLLCKFALAGRDFADNKRFEAIGRDIVKKLNGLPLAVRTIGSLLYSRQDEIDWTNILHSEIWNLPEDNNDILPPLRLSYQNLPSRLKQCFSYCSLFPKGYEFDKDKLIKIWMAQGFIHRQGMTRMEDVGAEYFDDLLGMSFFQNLKDFFVMHDMIHVLAQFVSANECFMVQDDGIGGIPKRIHHLSLSSSDWRPISFKALYEFKRLRTLIVLHEFASCAVHIPPSLFLELRYLRVLDFSGTLVRELPETIGKLKYLRYLDLSATSIERLPESTSRLYNLQTLKLRDCYSLRELPEGMTNLISLRHLEADETLISKIAGIGKLTCLQELPLFMVRNEIGYRISELEGMMELRRLCIWSLENVVYGGAGEAKLNHKQHLRKLELEWDHDRVTDARDGLDRDVLEGLEPHTNLKELNIDGYNGTGFPRWVGNPLFTALVKVSLNDCKKCSLLPPLGQLHSLKNLTINGLHGIKHVGREFSGYGLNESFPSLGVLQFEELLEWVEWSGVEIGQFRCLRELSIKDCPKLNCLPVLSLVSLKHLKIENCPQLTSLPPIDRSGLPLSLQVLRIGSCSDPNKWILGGIKFLTSLQDLSIIDCQNLEFLPEGLHNLHSLKSLCVHKCPQIVALPRDGLPASLQCLSIRECPVLWERCQKETGQDWPMISHIPMILVD